MISASLLAALLSFSPAPTSEASAEPPAPTAGGGAAAPSTDAEYEAAKQRVRDAQRLANEDPPRGSKQLRDALQLLQRHAARLAIDPQGQDLRTMAQLTLARALLATDKSDEARDVMDEAIRTAHGDPLPTRSFGPGLSALHKERIGTLEKLGTAAVRVQCEVACRVYLNERPTGSDGADNLIPGRYRVYIESSDGETKPMTTVVDVATEGDEVKLEFGEAPTIVLPPVEPEAKPFRRVLPRWAEITMMAGGVAAIGVGAALYAIDGHCPKLSDPLPSCPEIYATDLAGAITMAGGGALFLAGTVTLAVDEVRVGKQRGREASLVWTMRF
ncbi:tetratricopeptide repeat protein [Pseudenhygromyxa sp. WMMC2535]|uniref:tetratricopeptide repeat protein n=1 Tax=Pseudenhygromyxa sp. WMMC2535 TaxID=2712867 RepID=UPI00155731F7|nr:tetratricopeptide repeat protein [Pseudenhygromyxa sp. WMMC2535]NVB41474.1 tetratricopeptide repeat protein [Pseudenhygromyxa sp. WMMC2535]